MRKSFGAKAICYPMPVFIIGTYNADGTPNAMNAAWGGISEETEITICVDSGHKTAENLMTRKAFTVSMATADHVAACDYVGLVSGNKEPDKFAKAGFHATKSEYVDAPPSMNCPWRWSVRLFPTTPKPAAWWGESSMCLLTNPFLERTAKWMWVSSVPSPLTP